MTRSVDPAIQAALALKNCQSRDFVWFIVRNRDTGAPVTDGYWSDIGTITASVIDPLTGNVSSRTWNGAAQLIEISDIHLTTNLSVQNVTIKLSQVSNRINNLIRTYDCKQGAVQIFRGLYDLTTQMLVAPAEARFVGTIDTAPVNTPQEGEAGDVTLTCTSNTQELTRINPDTRSDASQRIRSATDNFYQDVAVVGSWQQFWGRNGGAVRTVKSGFISIPGLK